MLMIKTLLNQYLTVTKKTFILFCLTAGTYIEAAQVNTSNTQMTVVPGVNLEQLNRILLSAIKMQ